MAAHARGNPITPPGAATGGEPGRIQLRLQGAFLTVIGLAGMFGGVLFSIEAPRFTPVPVVFLTFWLVMVLVGKILFTGLNKLRDAGVGAPAPQQLRAAAAVAGIIVAVGMMGFAATGAGSGVAAAAPCPGGGPATCGPDPGAPTLTFSPPAQQTAPTGQQGGQQGQDQNGIATSPRSGGDNGPGIQAQTPEFGTPGQQAPNIPGNEQPGQGQQGGQQPQQGQQTGQQNPVRTTAPGRPDQNQQQTGQQDSGRSSEPTVTVTKTESQCAVPGAGGNGATPGGGPGGAASDSGSSTGGPDSTSGSGEDEEGAPSWAYLVGEVSALMTGRRGRKAGPLNKDGSTPTNNMVADDQIDGDNYKQWTTPDGDRTYILSQNKDAPSKYRFNLNQPDGGSSKVNDDGSVSVFDRNGNQVNRFEAPWAYDTKTGEKIPTRYSIDGNDLVQTIDRPEGNNNPILADPNPDGTPTFEETMATLQGSSVPPTGPYTPEQEAARGRAAEIESSRKAEQAARIEQQARDRQALADATNVPPIGPYTPGQEAARARIAANEAGLPVPPSQLPQSPQSSSPDGQQYTGPGYGEIAEGNAKNPVNITGAVGGTGLDAIIKSGEKLSPADLDKIKGLGKGAGYGILGPIGVASSVRDDIDNGMSVGKAVVSETAGFGAGVVAAEVLTPIVLGAVGLASAPALLTVAVGAGLAYGAGVLVSSAVQRWWPF